MVETSRQKDVVPFSLPKGKIKGQDVDLPSIKKKKKRYGHVWNRRSEFEIYVLDPALQVSNKVEKELDFIPPWWIYYSRNPAGPALVLKKLKAP